MQEKQLWQYCRIRENDICRHHYLRY